MQRLFKCDNNSILEDFVYTHNLKSIVAMIKCATIEVVAFNQVNNVTMHVPLIFRVLNPDDITPLILDKTH